MENLSLISSDAQGHRRIVLVLVSMVHWVGRRSILHRHPHVPILAGVGGLRLHRRQWGSGVR